MKNDKFRQNLIIWLISASEHRHKGSKSRWTQVFLPTVICLTYLLVFRLAHILGVFSQPQKFTFWFIFYRLFQIILWS